MTSSLPLEAREAFARFITCEYTTVDARQQPITWPVTPYYDQGAPTIDITTGLGYPKKAEDARRNPRVSLLFSDPTGSGTGAATRVLVQGIADVDDRDLEANRDRYWRESGAKLPATKDRHPPAFMRRFLTWYYTRIYVRIRPERVFVWGDGDVTNPPQLHDAHLEEVRSGHIEEPLEPHEPATGGRIAWDPRLEQLGDRYPEAVLSWVAPDGFPLSVRLDVTAAAGERLVRLGAEPAGLPLTTGPACVTAHRHGPDFEWQRNFQVRGDLVRDGRGWALAPHKLVGGFEVPDSQIEMLRENFRKSLRFARTARKELKKRKAREG
ncbi:MAG: pyridoxamine 5'-phosphate oxidase family protein [bacterium]